MSHVRTQSLIYDPAVTASGAYTANDAVGDLQSIRLATFHGAGVLKDIKVIDTDNQKAPLTILIFRDQPSGIAADNAAYVLSAADAKLLIAKVNIAAADYETIGARAVADVEVSKVFRGAPDTPGGTEDRRNLWVSVLTTGTPTYTTTSSLRIILGLLNDN
jgi:hypothetical protein